MLLTILKDNKIDLFIQEERLNRKKHSALLDPSLAEILKKYIKIDQLIFCNFYNKDQINNFLRNRLKSNELNKVKIYLDPIAKKTGTIAQPLPHQVHAVPPLVREQHRTGQVPPRLVLVVAPRLDGVGEEQSGKFRAAFIKMNVLEVLLDARRRVRGPAALFTIENVILHVLEVHQARIFQIRQQVRR